MAFRNLNRRHLEALIFFRRIDQRISFHRDDLETNRAVFFREEVLGEHQIDRSYSSRIFLNFNQPYPSQESCCRRQVAGSRAVQQIEDLSRPGTLAICHGEVDNRPDPDVESTNCASGERQERGRQGGAESVNNTTTPGALETAETTTTTTPSTATKKSPPRRKYVPHCHQVDPDKVASTPKARAIGNKAKAAIATIEDIASTPSPKRKRKLNDSGDVSTLDLDTFSPVRRNVPVSHLLNRPVTVARPATPEIDMSSVSNALQSRNIQASNLKFGFLGLGIMGCGIVKNLLNSGHSVVVWNRTATKCRKFQEAGAEVADTPSDVIEMTDVTFSCVSDPQVAKDLVFGNCGVMSANLVGKGYVEMTGVDPETSQDIAEQIISKGGRYLEAQIQGSKNQAEEGTLIILAAGERLLFEECQTCFEAISRNSFYLGDVGNATKMNLVLQMIHGVTLAGIAEGLALADRAGLQQKDVLEVLELTNMSSEMLLQKGNAIIKGEFPTHQPLKHMQKDLKLALGMADGLEQSLPITAASNEVYKHAKRLGYGSHDASAVYVRARF
ncbi:3-hydroxyisobutyrate dehydrogenase [Culex quinquefasciatus]|uniref:Cytokine-like nuclear factor N-PAC n=1 Tax=Culex quinquefasciatus TaxID=7176 RepID=B0W036_CULQU|nr:3-hydroxyisobutyrate dehydrogenase [Culex quinquefasciatus]|eukprot:XP_001842070.1 3-hydroxyisobutyrate dehydrogenase [Culex quinquefasciatus]